MDVLYVIVVHWGRLFKDRSLDHDSSANRPVAAVCGRLGVGGPD